MRSRLAGAALLVCGAFTASRAQDPSRDYLTIATPHFRVSFTRPLEPLARRIAPDAERAYAQLSRDLHPPRGTIDILVTDDFDFSNGSAITYPTNRIIVYAMPPVNDFGLRYTTDWAQMVVTHELAHIFHLDRVRGVWRLGQYLFGRSPFLFPNSYQPSWLIEGLAVYEESRLSGQGRIEGPEHTLLIRAAALDHRFPRIGDASLARPTFPMGSSAYGYGSLFLDYLARTRGDSSIRRLVESSSAQPVPYLIDLPARSAFGMSFEAGWAEWRRSIEATLGDSAHAPLPAWRDLTRDQLAAGFPRWLDDGRITFTGTTGREVLSAYAIDSLGRSSRIGLRQGLSPTTALSPDAWVFSQFEYTGPYEYRSDLFVQPTSGGRAERLTFGQRLFAPDVNAQGVIVAAQALSASSRIVRVRPGEDVHPLIGGGLDTLYSEPRWSHDGARVVASRWIRGGVAQIVVFDASGANVRVVASGRQVLSNPSWLPGDKAIAFSTGFDVWRADLASGAITRVSNAASGIFEPEFRGDTVAATTLQAGGYRLGRGLAATGSGAGAFADTTLDPRLPALALDSSAARGYSALRQLLPRYWVPLVEEAPDDAFMLGGYTESWDILRRHYLYLEARVPTDNSGINWTFEHQYRGLGRPILSTTLSQNWAPFAITSGSARIGTLRRRISDGDLLTSFVRQRVRSTLSLSVGAGIERRDYAFDPEALRATFDTGGRFRSADFPRVTAAASYARYYTPAYAISAEDGFTAAVTARERFRSGFNATGGPSTSVVGALSLFKSLDLPGYAHHVIALRGSAGWADMKSPSVFDVGGVSGGTFQVFPGYTVGEGRRTFPVRGFDAGVANGIRALSASAEYRAPLSLGQQSLGTLPTFLQRSALTLFSDYGVAWCPSSDASGLVCFDTDDVVKRDLASVGGEFTINAGLLSWDVPTRLRFGVAVPVHNGSPIRARSVLPYFTTGISF